MTKESKALRMALEALEKMESYEAMDAAITAIKKALAQPKREWVGLTGDDMDDIALICIDKVDAMLSTEARLKELNT